jgi:hypothetical protein
MFFALQRERSRCTSPRPCCPTNGPVNRQPSIGVPDTSALLITLVRGRLPLARCVDDEITVQVEQDMVRGKKLEPGAGCLRDDKAVEGVVLVPPVASRGLSLICCVVSAAPPMAANCSDIAMRPVSANGWWTPPSSPLAANRVGGSRI